LWVAVKELALAVRNALAAKRDEGHEDGLKAVRAAGYRCSNMQCVTFFSNVQGFEKGMAVGLTQGKDEGRRLGLAEKHPEAAAAEAAIRKEMKVCLPLTVCACFSR
jgi:hypothetical protein